MKVTNLSQVKHLIALALSVAGSDSLLVVETLKGEDQKTVVAKSGAVFFDLQVDEVPGNKETDLGLGSLIAIDQGTGEITVVGYEKSPEAQALIKEGAGGEAAARAQEAAKPVKSGRTCSERVRND